MDGVEAPKRMPLDQIAGENQNVVAKVHPDIGSPVLLELLPGPGPIVYWASAE